MNASFLQKLREIKDATALSEATLAEHLGISQSSVNRILNGQTDCRGSTLQAIEALHARVVGARDK